MRNKAYFKIFFVTFWKYFRESKKNILENHNWITKIQIKWKIH